MKKELHHTNYAVAVKWCNNALVLCNNIPEIDDSVWDNFEPIVDLDYETEYDEEGEEIKPRCPECGEGEDRVEIFQWYITDCSKWDVEYLTETFGLLFTYSDLLDCYILCVTHFGTGWDYVDWYTTNPIAKRELGEKK